MNWMFFLTLDNVLFYAYLFIFIIDGGIYLFTRVCQGRCLFIEGGMNKKGIYQCFNKGV